MENDAHLEDCKTNLVQNAVLFMLNVCQIQKQATGKEMEKLLETEIFYTVVSRFFLDYYLMSQSTVTDKNNWQHTFYCVATSKMFWKDKRLLPLSPLHIIHPSSLVFPFYCSSYCRGMTYCQLGIILAARGSGCSISCHRVDHFLKNRMVNENTQKALKSIAYPAMLHKHLSNVSG